MVASRLAWVGILLVVGCSGDGGRPDPTGPPVPQAPPDIIVTGFAYVLRAVNDSPIQGNPRDFVVFATGTCKVGGVAGVDSIGIGPVGGFLFLGDIGAQWRLQWKTACYADSTLLLASDSSTEWEGTYQHVLFDTLRFGNTGPSEPPLDGAKIAKFLSSTRTATELVTWLPDDRAAGGGIKLTYRR